MKAIKLVLALALITTLTLGMGGCINKKNIPEEMLQYMRDKYHEEFTMVVKDKQSWMSGYRMMEVEPAAFPGERVDVWWDKETGEITDGYLALKVNAEVEKEISAVAFEVYGENKVFNLVQTQANSGYKDPNLSAIEFLQLKPRITNASIWVVKDSSDKDSDVETFRRALKTKGYYLSFYVIYIEKETFPFLNDENCDKYSGSYGKENSSVYDMGYFVINESFELAYYGWK